MSASNSTIVDSAWDSVMAETPQESSPAEVQATSSVNELDLDAPDTQNVSTEESSNSQELETPAPSKEVKDDVEYVYVSDDAGRKKIKVDYSNKEAIKTAYKMAFGMRKFQAERDSYKERVGSLEEKAKNFDRFEELWAQGPESLLNALDPVALDKLVEERMAKVERRRNASEEELRLIELEEREAAREAENKKLRETVEKQLQESRQREEAASIQKIESQLHPQFHRYSFNGKLGDAKVEHRYNQFLWTQAMDALSKYPDNVQLTPAMIEKEFREISLDLKKVIAKQSQEVADRTIAAKKVAAHENAAARATQVNRSSFNQQIKDDISKGNTGGALDKLFSVFGK